MREGFKDLPGGTSDGQITGGNGAGNKLPEQMAQEIWQTMPILDRVDNRYSNFKPRSKHHESRYRMAVIEAPVCLPLPPPLIHPHKGE